MTDSAKSEALRRQHAAVRAEFSNQAVHWGQDAIDEDLLWAVGLVPLAADADVLDVAAGSALLGRAIAPRVRRVVAVDITPSMLAEGKRNAEREGIANMRFEEGAAEDLPYPEASFDAVVTRFSFHHFRFPMAALAQMARVCRPGGHVAVIDIVSPEDPGLAERYNRLERLRDPSHTRALGPSELVSHLRAAGLSIVGEHSRDVANDLDQWLERSRTPEPSRAEILRALTAELEGGEPSGMRPYSANGRPSFLHCWDVVIGRR